MSKSLQEQGCVAGVGKITKAKRREIAIRAAEIRWARFRDPRRIPKAVTEGVLKLGDIRLDVSILNDRRQVVNTYTIDRIFQLELTGENNFRRLILEMTTQSVFDQDLIGKIGKPISFRSLDGNIVIGYDAELLIRFCEAIINVKFDGNLSSVHLFVVRHAEIIVRSTAKLSISVLISEALGGIDRLALEYKNLFYNVVRSQFYEINCNTLDKLFDIIYRLFGLKRQIIDLELHKHLFHQFMVKFVICPLANGRGALVEQFHQVVVVHRNREEIRYNINKYLCECIGNDAIYEHIWQVIGIGEASIDKLVFERNLYRAFPEAKPNQILVKSLL